MAYNPIKSLLRHCAAAFMALSGITVTFPVTAVAQTPFELTAGKILASNPSLKGLEAAAEAQIQEFKAENSLAGPEVEFERLYNSSESSDSRWGLSVSQEIPWPGVFKARGEAASVLGRVCDLERDVERNKLRLQVNELLINYVAAKKTHKLTHEIARSMAGMLEHYRRAYELGEATIVDVNKAKIESVRAMMEDKQDEDLFQAYVEEIMALAPGVDLTDDLEALDEYPSPQLLDVDTYLASYEKSADRALAISRGDLAKASARLSAAGQLPGFAVGYVHAFEDNAHFNGFSVAMSLPSWNFRASKKASAARELEASFAAQTGRVEALQALRAEYIRAKSFKEQIAEFAPAVEQVNNLAILRRALDGGELTLLEYLQETAYFIQAYREYIRLNHDYALSLARLCRYM